MIQKYCVFHETGVPLVIIHFRIFPYKPSSYGDTTINGGPSEVIINRRSDARSDAKSSDPEWAGSSGLRPVFR